MIERRKFISGLISMVAAPAIVRASNLMPVKTMAYDEPLSAAQWRIMLAEQREINRMREMYAQFRWISFQEALERWPITQFCEGSQWTESDLVQLQRI